MSFVRSLFKLLKWSLLGLGVLAIFLVYRTLQFSSTPSNIDKVTPISIDYPAAIERVAGALRFRTISEQNPEDRNPQAFLDLHQYLESSFPLVHQNLKLTKVGKYSLLYQWSANKAKSSKKPVLLMAHMDVVPVDQATLSDWQHPPFDGVVGKDNIWGRGALDDKAAVVAILESVETLLSEGFEPSRDIYLAFGHDEEVGGENGAKKIAEHLSQKGVRLEYTLDEGGFVTQGLMPGLDKPIALIGVAEKGYVTVELSVQSEGGHSSVPPESTSIGIVSQAIVNLEDNPFEARLVPATEEMLTTIGKSMPFTKRLVFANLWLFRPFLLNQLSQSKLTNATIRTTIAATVFNAGDKENALPIKAKATINLRLLPGDTVETAVNHINRAINDPRVKVSVVRGGNATPIADSQSDFFKQLSEVIDQVSPEQQLIVVPNLMVGGTDSKHFVEISENVYRFGGVKIDPKSLSGFHGTNEYLPKKEYHRAINFYYNLLKINE
jgi:carboxypeptidase PM20D1